MLTATGACAVHCRYCFRRHFPYNDANPAVDQWQRAVDYIAQDASISEVILSGGDPLSLSERRLHELVQRLQAIVHVKRLRFHTRLPIVLPERVNAEFLAWFSAIKLKTVVVLHVNHANEIDASVRAALAQLQAAGASLLNQSVLLRGVNDTAESLARLSEALFESGVLPYYLHLLDKVQGAAHFDVELGTAQQLMTQLQARLPGYLVPRLVREISGAPSKVSVF